MKSKKQTEIESDYFFTSAIILLKEGFDMESAKLVLKELAHESKKENGIITFEIQQILESNNQFMVWECYRTKEAFSEHLSSPHFHEFENTKMFEFVKGYTGKKI